MCCRLHLCFSDLSCALFSCAAAILRWLKGGQGQAELKEQGKQEGSQIARVLLLCSIPPSLLSVRGNSIPDSQIGCSRGQRIFPQQSHLPTYNAAHNRCKQQPK